MKKYTRSRKYDDDRVRILQAAMPSIQQGLANPMGISASREVSPEEMREVLKIAALMFEMGAERAELFMLASQPTPDIDPQPYDDPVNREL